MQEQEIARRREEARKKRKRLIIAAILVGVFGLSLFHVIESHPVKSVTTNSVSSIPWGKVFLASKTVTSPTVKVYYISWLGCPIGATDSWALFEALSSKANMSGDISFHTSSPTDVFPNTPGLIFENFTGNGFSLQSIYVYGNSINLTSKGGNYQGTAIDYSNNILRNELPNSIYDLEINLTEKVPLQGNGVPSAYLSVDPHLNTNIIITNKNGTFMVNGPLYSPSLLQGLTPNVLYDNLSQYAFINSASRELIPYL